MAERRKNFEAQMSEMKDEIMNLIEDPRVSVGQGMVIEKSASFSLNVSQLNYAEVIQVRNKLKPHGFFDQPYRSGDRYLLIMKRLFANTETFDGDIISGENNIINDEPVPSGTIRGEGSVTITFGEQSESRSEMPEMPIMPDIAALVRDAMIQSSKSGSGDSVENKTESHATGIFVGGSIAPGSVVLAEDGVTVKDGKIIARAPKKDIKQSDSPLETLEKILAAAGEPKKIQTETEPETESRTEVVVSSTLKFVSRQPADIFGDMPFDGQWFEGQWRLVREENGSPKMGGKGGKEYVVEKVEDGA